ncbi:LysR family transcriptional regulator [Verrucomicrobiales bacterium]|nr:LysR family transcriptional regulator [Verrucomicrobiales bacterium]MDB4527016.1 LysR family transcriptional regulator [bacterium]
MGYRASVTEEESASVGHQVDQIGEVTDLRQLRIFQSLARTWSFTETAGIMSVTQSAVSHSIKALEKSLGCTLFDRRGKVLSLTQEGETLLVSASEVIRELRRASQNLAQLRSGELNTVRFGSTDSICEFVLPEILNTISKEDPEANIVLKIGDAEELAQSLNDGSIDIMLGIVGPNEGVCAGVQSAFLFRDTLRLITSPQHPWNARKVPLDAKALSGERFLLFGSDSITNKLSRDWFDYVGASDCRMIDVPSVGTLKNLARAGFGVGLVPQWILETEGFENPLIDFELPVKSIDREWMLIMRKTHSFSSLEKRFIALLKQATIGLSAQS